MFDPTGDALEKVRLELFDPRRGGAPFRIAPVAANDLREAQRLNCFTVLWIRKGSGIFHADLNEYRFAGPSLLFANPYQILFLSDAAGLQGMRLDFHANFFCIETYHEEVGCNGVLFNDLYGEPVLPVPADRVAEVDDLAGLMREEVEAAGLAHAELLLSYLKVFLIKATRLKVRQQGGAAGGSRVRPEALERLVELVEIHYRERHRPGDYAQLLAISEKALNKLVRTHLGKTLTVLIRERVLKHAKWHLLHTRKPVKEVAAEVGFGDEFYFSRVFKRATGFAPSAFREFETAIRSGRNLANE